MTRVDNRPMVNSAAAAAAAVTVAAGSRSLDPHPAWRGLAIRGLLNLVFCVALGLALWLLAYRDRNVWVVQLYSVAIGVCCWLFIDGGRLLLAHGLRQVRRPTEWRPAPGLGWPVTVIVAALGGLAGHTLGTALADAIVGLRTPSLVTGSAAGLLSVLIALVATYFFYQRERLQAEIAATQAARSLALENQLKLLQSQLEPHMLFNTLANLRVLISLDPAQAQHMLDRLIAFLRATLTASRSAWHPLAAEFDRLADYLALMAVRMGPRLAVRFDLPDDLRALPVPPLLLQPLVENAIKHGLEPKIDGGRIEVTARLDAGMLCLTVRDTGVGLGAAPAGDGSRFGLTQVRDRLAALFGERAQLLLQPAADAPGGTVATLRLPVDPPLVAST